jgi:hypothetical protein
MHSPTCGTGLGIPVHVQTMEATSGFEPLNGGFADLCVKPLHHVAVVTVGRIPDRECPAPACPVPPRWWLPLEDSNLG